MAHNTQREEQPAATASGKYIIQSALRTLRALDLFTTYNTNIGVAEMQKELNINSNMAFRILHTLEAAKYVVQDPTTGKYRLSLKIVGMGNAAATGLPITQIAQPYLRLLSSSLNHKINVVLFVFEQDTLIVAEKIPSNLLPKVFAPVGRAMPIHTTAAGKMLVSSLDDNVVRRLLTSAKMERYTEHSITDIDRFIQELSEVRRTQLAWEREENYTGLNGVAAPIYGYNDRMLASVCINAFTDNTSLAELELMAVQLSSTVQQISAAVTLMK